MVRQIKFVAFSFWVLCQFLCWDIQGVGIVTPNLGHYTDEADESTLVSSKLSTFEVSSTAPATLVWALSGKDSTMFNIIKQADNIHADLILVKPLDFEDGSSTLKQATVTVTDSANSIEIPVNIRIKNIVDEKPVFSKPNYVCQIKENEIGTCVDIKVTDVETSSSLNDKITCTISGPGHEKFEFTDTPCLVKPISKIDREGINAQHSFPNLIITAKDKMGLFNTASLSITILDINDNPPGCTPNPTPSTEITKTEQFSGVIETLTCTDKDQGANANMDCASTDSRFSAVMSNDKCTISLNSPLDFDTLSNPIINFDVLIKDLADTISERKTATINYKVTITNVFDIAPVFTKATYSCSFKENSKTDICDSISVSDKETSDPTPTYDPKDEITCSLSGTLANTYFEITSPDCHIKLKDVIDYEDTNTPNNFPNIIVKATDKGNNFDTATVSITITDINDITPSCTVNPPKVSVLETYNGVVADIPCEDKDSGDNGKMVCTTINTDVTTEMINDKCRVTLKDPKDFEVLTVNPIKFDIIVSDSPATGKRSITIPYEIQIIDVFDYAPRFSATSYNCEINEESAGSCTSISVSDVETTHNPADAITCSLSGINHNYFRIESPSCKIVLNSPIDYEDATKPKRFAGLTVQATDKKGNFARAGVIVNIKDLNDNNPLCNVHTVRKTVPETFTGVLERLTCTDSDTDNNGKMSCSSTNPKIIATMIGTICTLHINTPIDFEGLQTNPITFNVVIRDHPPNNDDTKTTVIPTTLTITDVFDVAPIFIGAPYTCTIIEEAIRSCSSALVTDVETGHSPPDDVTCSISGPNSNYFTISSPNCIISTATVLDFDDTTQPKSFPGLIIKATDKGGNFNTATLSLTIRDSNDNSPVCVPSSLHEIRTESFTGVINKITCTDKDSGANAKLVCSSTETRVAVVMTGNECTVTLVSPVDYESLSSTPITFNVVIKDEAANVNNVKSTIIQFRFATVKKNGPFNTPTVSMIVTDVNDNAPDCVPTDIHETITNTFTGEVSRISCTDKDQGDNAKMICSTTELKVSVEMSGTSCIVSVKNAIDEDSLTTNPLKFNITIRDRAANSADVQSRKVSYQLSVTGKEWYEKPEYIALLVLGCLLGATIIGLIIGFSVKASQSPRIMDSRHFNSKRTTGPEERGTSKNTPIYKDYNPYGV